MACVKFVKRPAFATYTLFYLLVALIPGAITEGINTTDTFSAATESTTTLTAWNGTQSHNSSSALKCTLLLRNKEIMILKLRDIFSKGAIFVYFKLEFNSTFTIYSNISDAVDPFTWVLAVDGKGKLLLTYPFDFEQLSLGTLSYGVFHMNLTVAVPLNGCFQKAGDRKKRQILASLVIELVQSLNDTQTAGKELMVCFERQLTFEEFDLIGVYAIPLCTYYVFQASASYNCWMGDGESFDSEPMIVRKHVWLGRILFVGFVLAFFSPLAASFFIQKNPPVMFIGEEYYRVGLNSDLPLGLKYSLCFSRQDCTLIVAARWLAWLVCAVAFVLIPFIPVIIAGDSFSQRRVVAFELLLSESLVRFWVITITMIYSVTTAVLFFVFYAGNDNFVPDLLEVTAADRRYFGFAVDMPVELRVPEVTDGTPLSTFMFTMLYRTQMAVNPDVWYFFFHPIWTYIRGRGFWTFVIFPFAFIFAVVTFLVLLLFNSVPLIYTVLWISSKCIDNHIRPSRIILAVFTVLLSFAAVFIFVAAFVYVAELVSYVFIGFVVNYDNAGAYLVFALTVADYIIKAATTFYDEYCILLKRVIEAAERVDISRRLGRGNCLLKFKEGVPFISLPLFQRIVAKYQPLYLEVAAIILRLVVIIVVMVFGFSTIVFIDGISDLPAVVEFFATVIVAGVIRRLELILKSPASEENKGVANAKLLEHFLRIPQ
ncbi:uncharacterized protein [Diadema antillarum]|uniref:uncharacterized protein n=1 Tax=Diadema antillarum TaxID=105358 RepID=UPI003A8C4C0F